jgi:hypothetical protein
VAAVLSRTKPFADGRYDVNPPRSSTRLDNSFYPARENRSREGKAYPLFIRRSVRANSTTLTPR